MDIQNFESFFLNPTLETIEFVMDPNTPDEVSNVVVCHLHGQISNVIGGAVDVLKRLEITDYITEDTRVHLCEEFIEFIQVLQKVQLAFITIETNDALDLSYPIVIDEIRPAYDKFLAACGCLEDEYEGIIH